MAGLTDQIQAYGIQPVPVAERRLGFVDTFVLWWDLGVSFLVMAVGMFLVPGLSLGQALLAILVGAVVGNCLLGLVGTIGSDTGVPTMVLFRPVLGLRGSIAPTVLNLLQLLGWATFEVIVMAQAAALLSERLVGVRGYLGWVLFFAVLGTAMAVVGPILVVKQWMERFAVWVVLLTLTWITVAVLTTYDVRAWLAKPGTGEMSFWLGVDLVAVMPISWVPLVADYSRMARLAADRVLGHGPGLLRVPRVVLCPGGAPGPLRDGALRPQRPHRAAPHHHRGPDRGVGGAPGSARGGDGRGFR